MAYLQDKQYSAAIVAFDQYLKDFPKAPPEFATLDMVTFYIGESHFKSGQFDEAKETFARLVNPSLIEQSKYYLEQIGAQKQPK